MLNTENESKYLPILATAFANQSLAPEFGVALARQESNFDPNCANLGPGDRERGGSYGLCQMSLQTARGLGHVDITPEQVKDPAVNASLAAELCAQNYRLLSARIHPQQLSPDFPYADLAAMYNSGKPLAKAPWITANNYVPRVLKFMAEYRDRCAQYAVCK